MVESPFGEPLGSGLFATLVAIRRLAVQQRVRLTFKASCELDQLGLGIDTTDVCDVLARLVPKESRGRVRSKVTGDWLHVFGVRILDLRVYIKVAVGEECVVVSFHEEDGG